MNKEKGCHFWMSRGFELAPLQWFIKPKQAEKRFERSLSGLWSKVRASAVSLHGYLFHKVAKALNVDGSIQVTASKLHWETAALLKPVAKTRFAVPFEPLVLVPPHCLFRQGEWASAEGRCVIRADQEDIWGHRGGENGLMSPSVS